MVAYADFVGLSQSADSEERGLAAHLAAQAYLQHTGPADEHAALYAALIGFLDDPSVKVRAALAYGLLHAVEAPRPILMALLADSPIIARAVLQYSPALIDADILSSLRDADEPLLRAVSQREHLSLRVADALVAKGNRTIILTLLRRPDVPFEAGRLADIASGGGRSDPALRGALLARADLPATARFGLVEAAALAMRSLRVVKGAVAPGRLDRLMRNALDTALTTIGETSPGETRAPFAADLAGSERLNSRLLLHALIHGQVLFFAECLGKLSESPAEKVFALLERGSRPALNALLSRCGLGEGLCNLVARLVMHARQADLADDAAARHYVLTAVTEELIAEHEGAIPPDLEEAFTYLSEQNVQLARRAARGVMSSFAGETTRPMPVAIEQQSYLSLPAA